MPQIRPVSDLRNNFADISRVVHETSEPVFLTKNGYGDMVVMSMEAYERKLFESDIYFKLKEAELEAKSTNKRFSHEEVFSDLRAGLVDKVNKDNVSASRTT
ncbi:type II toxin-antitoxin system Phd/YefM family antitoxin [Clostridium pasteurianum]|uniref:Antitoxin n=1 Tax=Clostridium pasteurianum BC1 TaxID=86416 RepID=R4KBC4_CLOPA|nr:type II toxin-antitoxin system Phd/YefM family antitoxin [Clostridium pasteurianum]AGK96930.1 prevent-host-death family protein [Clostridium pasteurianum BC1]